MEAQASEALFTQSALTLLIPEGPQAGQPLIVSPPPENTWTIGSASPATSSSVGSPPPAHITLPYGVVNLKLVSGTAGTSATVVLTYPETLPAGTRYYKFGKTLDEPSDHWYEFSGAEISGNTITLTLTDGGAGDNDLAANGQIDDPGGPAVVAGGAMMAIPTLSRWGVVLLMLLTGVFAAWQLKRPQGVNTF